MAFDLTTIFVACDACQGEGRILTQGYIIEEEIDHGVCPECHGECVVEVEAHPVTLEDMEVREAEARADLLEKIEEAA